MQKTTKSILLIIGILFILFWIRTEIVKHLGLKKALELTGDFGIINIGSGYGRSPFATMVCRLPQVKVNFDINKGETPRFEKQDLSLLHYPFVDKRFDVAFASHVIEHIDDYESVLSELKRIAKYVVVVVPYPLNVFQINPSHKHWFTFSEINAIKSENVYVFY